MNWSPCNHSIHFGSGLLSKLWKFHEQECLCCRWYNADLVDLVHCFERISGTWFFSISERWREGKRKYSLVLSFIGYWTMGASTGQLVLCYKLYISEKILIIPCLSWFLFPPSSLQERKIPVLIVEEKLSKLKEVSPVWSNPSQFYGLLDPALARNSTRFIHFWYPKLQVVSPCIWSVVTSVKGPILIWNVITTRATSEFCKLNST